MAPTTRRSTRSSSGPSPSPSRRSPSKSPAKKGRKSSSSPKKVVPSKGRPRENKSQPRIDESLLPSKSTVHGEEENKKILSQDGVEGEVQMQVQLKSGIKRGTPYEIRETNTNPSSPCSSTLNETNLNRSFGLSSTGSNSLNNSQEEGGWSQDSYYSSTTEGSPSKLGQLLSSPAISSTSSYASSLATIGGKEDLKLDEMQVLKFFDMNHMFGPCRGISRRERYFRGLRYKVQPPPPAQVLDILNAHKHEKNYELDWETCIWDQHDIRVRGRQNQK